MAPLEADWLEAEPPLVRRTANRAVFSLLRAFWGIDISGLERLPRSGALIVAGNHVANLDGVLLAVTVSGARCLRFLGKQEAFQVPLLGWFLRQCGCIPLDRSRGDVTALRAAEEVLQRGWSLGLFPEGTRNKTGARVKPKLGVAFLAARTGARVVPVRLMGTSRWPRSGRLEVRFGEPMAFSGDASDKAQLRDFAQAVMDSVFTL